MMNKTLCFGIIIWMAMAGMGMARSFDFELGAGSKSLSMDAGYRMDVNQGYTKVGFVGVYTDDDDTQYQWGGVRVVAGNDTMVQGLSFEVGMVGLYGTAEKRDHQGDVGNVAFEVKGKYLFAEHLLPIPLELTSSIRHAPGPLTFRDTESYSEFSLGLGLQLIENASVALTFTKYWVDFEAAPEAWDLDEDVIRVGIVLHF
jgi:hypothetical protein